MKNTFQGRNKITSLMFEDLTYKYDEGHVVFDNLDYDFPMDEYVWIRASHGGAGRSTLLHILAGLQSPTSGKYLINDQNISDMTFEEFLPYRLAIGYSFDLGGLLHNRTIFENLMLPLVYHSIYSYKEATNKVLHYMNVMEIEKYKDQRPSAVQGGVRKTACLIRPLLMNPYLLLLDEPTLGISQKNILKYFDLINEVRKEGYANHIFISSIDEKTMSLLPHKEILLDHGQIHSELQDTNKKVVNL